MASKTGPRSKDFVVAGHWRDLPEGGRAFIRPYSKGFFADKSVRAREIAKKSGLPYHTVYSRLWLYGWTEEEAASRTRYLGGRPGPRSSARASTGK